MTLAEVKAKLKVFGASDRDVREFMKDMLRVHASGTVSMMLLIPPFVVRVTWCRKYFDGYPATPLHPGAHIVWLGVTANLSP